MAGKEKPAPVPATKQVPVNTLNEYAISTGQNMDNHTMSMSGRKHFVRQMVPDVPTFRTKQAAYRYAAYILTLADNTLTADGPGLPDEDGAHTFEEVLHAIQNA